jgi:hypothetical protein
VSATGDWWSPAAAPGKAPQGGADSGETQYVNNFVLGVIINKENAEPRVQR